jgi:hypothetical protein
MLAVKWLLAAMTAALASRWVPVSSRTSRGCGVYDRGGCVGETCLGAPPRNNFFVLNFLLSELPLLSLTGARFSLNFDGSVSRGEGIVPPAGSGSGVRWSFISRIIGRASSRIFLFSSDMRSKSCFNARSSASAAIIRWSRRRIDSITLARSSWVAERSPLSPSAAVMFVSVIALPLRSRR